LRPNGDILTRKGDITLRALNWSSHKSMSCKSTHYSDHVKQVSFRWLRRWDTDFRYMGIWEYR